MKRILLTLVLITTLNTQAADYDLIYITKSGSKIDATSAILKASEGEVVYKCQTVEAKVSKSGTSISIKNIKKPKSEAK